jgi:hypothetical protein
MRLKFRSISWRNDINKEENLFSLDCNKKTLIPSFICIYQMKNKELENKFLVDYNSRDISSNIW